MRTTIRLNEELLADARRHAAATGSTLTALIEAALREALARRARKSPRRRIKLPTHGRGGLRPGVDLDDSGALAEAMDGR